jgi:hypothetical protein
MAGMAGWLFHRSIDLSPYYDNHVFLMSVIIAASSNFIRTPPMVNTVTDGNYIKY